MALSRRESIYLDLIRALSAVIVVIDHAPFLFQLNWNPRWGHQAVLVFYVLSGYVISVAADKPATNFLSFMIARLARLWSVLLPALLLTAVCDYVGRNAGINPGAYANTPGDVPGVRLVAAVLFVSEAWVSIQPLSNGVTWSLCAEFWYYALFAAWMFLPRGRGRTLVLVAACLLGGFKALLLLPVWLLGVSLHRSAAIRRLPIWLNMAMLVVCTVILSVILVTQFYDVPIAATQGFVPPWLFRQLAQVRVFWFDWLFGLLVFGHFLGARSVVTRLPLERIAGPVRWCAGVSFATYLLHMPLMLLLAAFVPGINGWTAILVTLAAAALVGHPIEQSRWWWAQQLGASVTTVGKLGARFNHLSRVVTKLTVRGEPTSS